MNKEELLETEKMLEGLFESMKTKPEFRELSKKFAHDVDKIGISIEDMGFFRTLLFEEGVLTNFDKHLHEDTNFIINTTGDRAARMKQYMEKKDLGGLIKEAKGIQMPLKYKIRIIKTVMSSAGQIKNIIKGN